MSPKTPDRTPGPSDEEEIQLEDRSSDGDPTLEGAIRYLNGDFRGMTAGGVKSLTTGSGLSEGQHRALDQLVHEVSEDSFTEYEYTGNRVDAIRIYTNSGKTTKIRESEFTYTANKVTQIVTKQYDGSGILAETYTETITYSGNLVTDVSGVLS